MTQFLNIIAKGYADRYDDISRLTFIMPNKRSGTFLLREFGILSRNAVKLAPRVLTISDFISSVADNVKDSRLDLLFRLYLNYKKLKGADKEMTFGKFTSWGDTVLNDFNEIDMQMANPAEIFKNVYDLNSIKSNFLSPHHKRVMAQYFGYEPDFKDEDYDRLWKKIEILTDNKSKTGKGVKKKFQSLWELLYPLYEGLKTDLASAGLTTEGGQYREAAEKIEGGFEPFKGEKLVFVGFNALSEAEFRIFQALAEMEINLGKETESKADFVWDRVSPFLADDNDPAQKFVARNASKDNFPMPDWIEKKLEYSLPDKAPDIKVIAVPSNVMQAKIAGRELQTFEKDAESIRNARVAVVLPDENMLIPLLYSLPSEYSNPNLTMGFPLKNTPVISFVSLIRRLQNGNLHIGREGLFFLEDVKNLLEHPYSKLLFDMEEWIKFIDGYTRERRLVVSATQLNCLGKNAETVFRSFNQSEDPNEIVKYILHIFSTIRDSLKEKNKDSIINATVESTYIATYFDAMIRLANCVREYGIKMHPEEVFMLADRLISAESVVFEGEPCQGLQIMGVLETRCLDFDKIIMLNVNEKIMPRVGRNTTFIPNVIRIAFGMPPANYQEEIFAYYFFRLIGRCSEAVLTYDSRSSENRTPGPSRYLLQMKYLLEEIKLKEFEASFELPKPLRGEISITKNEDLLARFRKFEVKDEPEDEVKDEKSAKVFSATSLNHYFNCPVQFLYRDVIGLKEEDEKLETIDAAELGSIVHKAIERLYFPEGMRGRMLERPILMNRFELDRLLNEKNPSVETRIEREARRAIMEIHFKMDEAESDNGILRGSAGIILEYIVTYIKYIIAADLRRAPFRLWGSEIERLLNYKLPDGRMIRFKMVIDRLDQEGGEGNHQPFRIVDYKTGNVHLKADDFEDIFNGEYKATNIFQLFLYAELFLLLIKRGKLPLPEGVTFEEFEENLQVVIYDITKLKTGEGIVNPAIGKAPDEKGKEKDREIGTIGKLRTLEGELGERFMDRLDEHLMTILDESTVFRAEPNDDTCRYCDFRLRCELLRLRNPANK